MKNKVLIGIIIILIGVIIAEGVYLFTNKEDEKENNSSINIPKEEEEENESNGNETSEDYVKLVDTREEDNQVIQEYEMVLNGEYQEFDITFEINENEYYWTIYSYVNSQLILSIFNDFEKSPDDWDNYIRQYFNEDNFIIFPGTDGINYLIIQDYSFPPAGGFSIGYKIFNQDWSYLGVLSVIENAQGIDVEDESIWYTDNLQLDNNNEEYQVRSKIAGNKIYNLYYDCSFYPDILEERIYTINNNKLEYEVINTYQVLGSSGAC